MSTGLRERKKEQTRVDLLRAAIELFREQGYEATTVDHIVDRANYSRSTFFRYFGTKEDVVFGDLAESLAEVLASLHAADPKGDPWLQAQEAITRQVLETASAGPELEAACLELWFHEPALQRRYVEMVLDSERRLAQFFGGRYGIDGEADVRCQTLAIAFVGVARATLRSQLHRGVKADIPGALEQGFDTLVKGRNGRRQ